MIQPWEQMTEVLDAVGQAMQPRDPLTAEDTRPDLQKQIWVAHTEVCNARVNSGIQLRLHGNCAPETIASWERYTDALRQLSDLIAQV